MIFGYGMEFLPQPVRDNSCFDGQLQVEIPAFVNELLGIHSHFFTEVSEQTSEQKGQKGSSKVKPFITVVISII